MKLFPAAVLAYLLTALVWPTWRTWRRAGVFPVVFHREAETAQRVVGALMGLFLAGLAVWSLLCASLEPGRLGIWQLAAGWHALGWLLLRRITASQPECPAKKQPHQPADFVDPDPTV